MGLPSSRSKSYIAIEVDETYAGGRERNTHGSKRVKAGRGTASKATVIGAKKRSGKIRARMIAGIDSAALEGCILENLETGATVFTDNHAYRSLAAFFGQRPVRRSLGEYVNGMAHTNSIESFWAMLKRGYQGTCHKISAKDLHRYVTEFAGRNVRDLSTIGQMTLLAQWLDGERLRHDKLVADHG